MRIPVDLRPAIYALRRAVPAFVSVALFATVAGAVEVKPMASKNVSLRNEVQHSIDRGLQWLIKNQNTNGYWSTEEHPAVTALALMALKGNSSKRDAKADEAIKKGYSYLESCVHSDGSIYQKKELLTHNTALAVMAFVAANKPEYRATIQKGRQFLIGLQNDFDKIGTVDNIFDGGIGYGSKYEHSDMANTVAALEAVYYSKPIAREKNIDSAKELNLAAAIQFLQNCQNLPGHNKQAWAADDSANKGGFVYYPGMSMAGEMTNSTSGKVALRSYGSASYAGLLSYIYADLKPGDPRVKAVLEWLQKNYTLAENPGMGPQGLFYYFHTMAKALTICGMDKLEVSDGRKIDWRNELALKLIDLQKTDGSWANENGRWWEKDPALVTAYGVLSLELIRSGL